MDAKKCDRCGEYYQPYTNSKICSIEDILKTTEKDIVGELYSKTCSSLNKKQYFTIYTYDLCPECMRKQVMFLKGTKLKEEQ